MPENILDRISEYFDPDYPPAKRLSAVRRKHFSFGNRREIRLLVGPERNPARIVETLEPEASVVARRHGLTPLL